MIRIGIDYSITSPSVCIEKEDGYRFISFYDNEGKDIENSKSKKFHYYKELVNVIDVNSYNRIVDKSNYRNEQLTKMKCASGLSNLILSKILDEINNDGVIKDEIEMGIEGFSYGSVSSSTIDLIMFQSFLRSDILQKFPFVNLNIISPTECKKKLSGKGNSNKEQMIKSFIENKLNDEKLTENNFWKYCVENNLDFKNCKPIDDLVDSYSILKSI